MAETKTEGVGVPVPVEGAMEFGGPRLESPANKVEALRQVSVFSDLRED